MKLKKLINFGIDFSDETITITLILFPFSMSIMLNTHEIFISFSIFYLYGFNLSLGKIGIKPI
tara:strand:+ start:435 stop:623 length:189 start_codon:yes stop_codon:yes gene_type:complete